MNFEESQTVEFKSIFEENKIKSEILAFINSNNGRIYVGVEDDKTIIGIPKEKHDEIANTISSWITNAYTPEVRGLVKYYFDNNDVLIIDILEGTQKPYYIKSKGPVPSGVYIRNGRSCQQATEFEIRYMLQNTSRYSFEEDISNIQKLHFISLARYFDSKEIEFNESKYLTLGIINVEGKFTNLGLLLSDENTIECKLAVYKDDTSDEFKVKKEFNGCFVDIAKQLLDYSELFNDTSAKIIGNQAQRKEIKSFPNSSLREAVINGLCHSDFSLPSNIKVEFYTDRVEVTSPGGLFGNAKLEDILSGVQTFRNPKLVNVFSKLEFIENYGTGLQRIIKAYPLEKYKKDDLFYVSKSYMKVTLPNLNYNVDTNVERNVERNVEQNNTLKLSENAKITLKLIKNNPLITRSEIADYLDVTTRTIDRALVELKENNLIQKKQSDKNGEWKILK